MRSTWRWPAHTEAIGPNGYRKNESSCNGHLHRGIRGNPAGYSGLSGQRNQGGGVNGFLLSTDGAQQPLARRCLIERSVGEAFDRTLGILLRQRGETIGRHAAILQQQFAALLAKL